MSDLVVVTGATGNVGAEVVKNLASTSYQVRIAARDPPAARAAGSLNAEVVPFAFETESTYAPALHGAQALFLMRPRHIVDVERYLNPVVDAARRAGVERIVFLSIAGAAYNPRVPHRIVEQHIEASGIAWTFLRADFFMQNLSTVHRLDIRDNDDVFVPAGEGKVAFVDVRDIAAVAARALTQTVHSGQACVLTGPRALDHFEVAKVLTSVLGRPIRYSNPTPQSFLEELLQRGVPQPEAAFITQVYAVVRDGHTGAVADDLQAVLGRPPTTFEQFASDYSDCWRPATPRVA